MPQQYNEEYEKAQNLNPLLSTYHIGAIMTVLKKFRNVILPWLTNLPGLLTSK